MSDEHGLGTEHVDGGAYIVHVIGDGTRVQRLRQGAGTMAAQADRDGTETFVGEKVQEMLIPTPCGQVSTVDEQQRRRVLIAARPLSITSSIGPFPDQDRRDGMVSDGMRRVLPFYADCHQHQGRDG